MARIPIRPVMSLELPLKSPNTPKMGGGGIYAPQHNRIQLFVRGKGQVLEASLFIYIFFNCNNTQDIHRLVGVDISSVDRMGRWGWLDLGDGRTFEGGCRGKYGTGRDKWCNATTDDGPLRGQNTSLR